MKRLLIFTSCLLFGFVVLAQDSTVNKRADRQARREERRQRTNSIIRQEEEGVLSYRKQSAFGLQLRTNGYGLFYELGRMRSPRFTNLYLLEITEILHEKEERSSSAQGFLLGNSYKYGKINNFYQAKLGYGQQYIFGQKGNKNGVAVLGTAVAGLSVGLLKPYYLQVNDNGFERNIRYTPEDSELFISGNIIGSSGFTKGWSEVKIKPGAFVKTALRFDFGSYNESITALEVGMSVEGYAQKIEQMLFNNPKQLFFQAHLAIVFGGRK